MNPNEPATYAATAAPTCARCGLAIGGEAVMHPFPPRPGVGAYVHAACARDISSDWLAAEARRRRRLNDAAPKLLAACRQFLHAWDNHDPDELSNGLQAARDAIAKATQE